VLQGRQALALAPDQGAEGLTLLALTEDVEAARLAHLELYANAEAHVDEELLEDDLPGSEGLGRGLGGFELGPLGGDGAAGSADLGGLALAQVRATARRSATVEAPAAAVVAARPAVVAARPTVIVPGPILTRRAVLARAILRELLRAGLLVGSDRAILPGRAVLARAAVFAEGPIVTPGAAVAVEAAATTIATVAIEAASAPITIKSPPGTVVVAIPRRWWWQGPLGGGFPLRGGPAELRAGRREDAGRLGAHAEDTPAPRGQDLEVEVVEPDPE